MDSSETRISMRIGEKTRFARIWPSASKISIYLRIDSRESVRRCANRLPKACYPVIEKLAFQSLKTIPWSLRIPLKPLRVLSLLHPLDRHRIPSAIGSVIGSTPSFQATQEVQLRNSGAVVSTLRPEKITYIHFCFRNSFPKRIRFSYSKQFSELIFRKLHIFVFDSEKCMEELFRNYFLGNSHFSYGN